MPLAATSYQRFLHASLKDWYIFVAHISFSYYYFMRLAWRDDEAQKILVACETTAAMIDGIRLCTHDPHRLPQLGYNLAWMFVQVDAHGGYGCCLSPGHDKPYELQRSPLSAE